MESKKNGKNELIYKIEIELQIEKTNLWFVSKGKGKGRDKFGDWD